MNKKFVYILTGFIGLLAGTTAALTSLKLLALFLAGAFLFAILLLDYEKVTYLVALYIVFDFTTRQVLGSPFLSGNWDELLFVFCVGLWIFKWFVYRRQTAYKWTPLEFPLILFICTGILLILVNSPETSIGIEGLRAVIEYMLWYFVVAQLLKTHQGARRMLYVLVFTGAALALHGIYQYVTKVPMPANWMDQVEQGVRTRAFSIVGSPNILGSLMTLLIPLSLSFVYAEKKIFKKFIFTGITLAMTLCLVVTFSRGAWVGLAVAVLIYTLMKNDKKLYVLLALSCVAVLIFVPSVRDRITYMLSSNYIASSQKGGRLIRWATGFDMFKQNMWIGVGLGRFGGAVAMNHKNIFPDTFYMDNYYLKTAVEMGLAGLSTFLILMYNVVAWSGRAIVRIKNSLDSSYVDLAKGALAGMCGVIVHNFFENVFEVPMMVTYFWLLAGFIMFLGYTSSVNQKDTGFVES